MRLALSLSAFPDGPGDARGVSSGAERAACVSSDFAISSLVSSSFGYHSECMRLEKE